MATLRAMELLGRGLLGPLLLASAAFATGEPTAAPAKLDAKVEQLLAKADAVLLATPGAKGSEGISAKVSAQLLAHQAPGPLVGAEVVVGAAPAEAAALAKFAEAKGPQLLYAEVVAIGSNVLLRYLAHEAPPAGPALKELELQIDSYSLRQRLAAVDLVVLAKVASFEAGKASVDEHDPRWSKATLKIGGTLKAGKGAAPATVEVRCPGSNDVLWAKAPRLHKDEEGLYLLSAVAGGLYELRAPEDLRKAADKDLVSKLLQLH
jgi:hypothetical protein